MRYRVLAAFVPTLLLAGGISVAGAQVAAAAPPEPFGVTVSATSTSVVAPVTISYDVNRAFRQITGVSYSIDGGASAVAPLPGAITNKSSRGSFNLVLAEGAYTVSVTVSGKGSAAATGQVSFVVSPAPGVATWCAGVLGTFSTEYQQPTGPGETRLAAWACLGADSDWVDGSNLGTSQSVFTTYCTPLGDPLQMRLYISQAFPATTLENYACVNMA